VGADLVVAALIALALGHGLWALAQAYTSTRRAPAAAAGRRPAGIDELSGLPATQRRE